MKTSTSIISAVLFSLSFASAVSAFAGDIYTPYPTAEDTLNHLCNYPNCLADNPLSKSLDQVLGIQHNSQDLQVDDKANSNVAIDDEHSSDLWNKAIQHQEDQNLAQFHFNTATAQDSGTAPAAASGSAK